jgi:hypothetical protein
MDALMQYFLSLDCTTLRRGEARLKFSLVHSDRAPVGLEPPLGMKWHLLHGFLYTHKPT